MPVVVFQQRKSLAMSNLLTPAVNNQLNKGHHILPLVKFEIPGNTVGYYVGPRKFEYQGFVYQPNKFLEMDDLIETLSIDLGERELLFSNVPVSGDPINDIEALDYTNAPVTVSRLIIDPKLGLPEAVIGVGETSFHKINEAGFTEGAVGEDGCSTLTMKITLGSLGVAGRDKTHAVRSDEEQRFDNNPIDTFLGGVSTVHTITREFGQRSG